MLPVAELRRRLAGKLGQSAIYRVVPLYAPRDALAILYLHQEKGPAAACHYLDKVNRLPVGSILGLALAGRSAFRASRDELLEKILVAAQDRYPERPEFFVLRSDLAAFRGNYEHALHYAESARLLAPDSADAAARSVRLYYLVRDEAEANANALAALQRFSHSSSVLWAVGKHCTSVDHFENLLSAWRAVLKRPASLSVGVRQLAHAALRVARCATAAELYAEAALIELSGKGVGKAVKEKSLKGKSGLSAISDLREVLEGAAIPFFLAAGTALGIVRDGRPLDHDNDIDVGIFEEDWDRGLLYQAFQRHPNFDFDSIDPKSHKIGLIHRAGAAIDLFRFYRENNGLYHDSVFVRWRNSCFALQQKRLPSGNVMLPTPIDNYLTENYGNWRTPDPDFDAFVQGPNVEVTWPERFAVHRIRQGYRHVRRKDLKGARREFSAAHAVLRESSVGRALLDALSI